MMNCLTCGKRLYGGSCRDNLEPECCEGGGYEAWQPRSTFASIESAAAYVEDIGWKGDYRIHKELGHYVLVMEG